MRNTCCLALLLIAISPAAVAKSTTYNGEVVVRSIDATRIAVFLDTDADHEIDNGFLLTTDIPIHGVLTVHMPAANLVFTDGHLRVTCENRVYDLQVAGYPDPPAAPKDSKVVTLIGSALTHSAGNSGCNIQRAQEKDAGACYAYGD